MRILYNTKKTCQALARRLTKVL